MDKVLLLLLVVLALSSGSADSGETRRPAGMPSADRHMKNISQLTFEGDNGEAYFSWDGTRIIWQSNRNGYACDKIWTMNIDGSDKRMVSPDHGAHTCSFFFPGNKKIVFASTSHLKGDCPPKPKASVTAKYRYTWSLYPYDIFVANADGSRLARITANAKYDAEPIISPDGKQIVFGSQREGDFDVYIMNADGSNLRRLTDRVGYDGGPWFSPDGKKIAWRAWYPETEEEKSVWQEWMRNDYIAAVPLDIWVMNADGSDEVRLTNNGAVNWAPSWHPDGNRIIFSSNMDDWREDIQQYGHNFELYLIDIDGTNLERITYNKVFDSFPMFSPDGKKLTFASNRNPEKPRATDIYLADWVK
jgi:Tol biopolymer transport system component